MRPRAERSPYWSGGIELAMLAMSDGREVKVSAAAEGIEAGSGKEVAGSGVLSDHTGSEVGVVEAEETASWILGDDIGLLFGDIDEALEDGIEEPHKLLE